MPSIEAIRRALASYEPKSTPDGDRPGAEAAVALVLHSTASGAPELLFIERARRGGDPWSGHMAFPGGRRDAVDEHLGHTAARETHEEVGLELGEPIGRLDEFAGTRHASIAPLVVAPFVYELPQRPALFTNHEVNDTVWVPLEWILDPRSAVPYRIARPDYADTFPAFRYEGYTVWGLTYRVLGSFLAVLGRELPHYSGSDQSR